MMDCEIENCYVLSCFHCFTQRTLSSLDLPRAVSVTSEPSTSISVGESPLNENQERTDVVVGNSSTSRYNVKQRQKVHDPARDLSIQVLEKFSLVTRFARETTSQLFRDGNEYGALERRNHNQSPLDYPQKASSVTEKVPDGSPVASDPLEVSFCSICILMKKKKERKEKEEGSLRKIDAMKL